MQPELHAQVRVQGRTLPFRDRFFPGIVRRVRRNVADWSAALLAIAILALGGLIVVKPALDNWDDVYRSDPFAVGTTTQKVRSSDRDAQRAKVSRTATTTTEDSSSFVERLLGKSGTLMLRLGLVALVAFLAGAVLQRALLGSYALRVAPRPVATVRNPSPESVAAPANGSEEPTAVPQNGADTPPEPDVPNLAPGIAKLVATRREALGLSQRELAKRAGISHTVISRIEGGDHSPSPKTLERLAEALR
jgi:DNA-binding XRE family transcriptional regulator